MRKIVFALVMLVAATIKLHAQDIKVLSFERNYTSLVASMNPVYDNAGDACAVIRFFVRDNEVEIDANLGTLKREDKAGEIRLWVPVGTKRITIRKQGFVPLNSYELPVKIESKITYDAHIELANKDAIPQNRVYLGAGYNIISISGPSVVFGVEFSNHMVELNAVYGLNKTDDWNFYDGSGNVVASYNYQALRFGLRYGYKFSVSSLFDIIPQIGAAYNYFKGNSAAAKVQNDTYKSANSFSGLGAVRFAINLSKHFQLQITPEYNFGITKNDACKLIGKNDNTFKRWTDGFNLNAGFVVKF